MRFTTFLTTLFLSGAVFAATSNPFAPTPSHPHLTNAPSLPAKQTNPQDSVASILEALREVNPEDAEAAASAMQIKLRRRDPAPVGNDLASILAALEANNPEDAAAAKGVQKRAEDLSAILAALEANNPEDAQAAKGGL
jgi:Lon protease-like protein